MFSNEKLEIKKKKVSFLLLDSFHNYKVQITCKKIRIVLEFFFFNMKGGIFSGTF